MLETTYSIKVCPAIRSNQVAQGFIPSDLENLQGWRLYNFSGQTAPLLDCPHCKKDFPKSTWNLCCFNLSPLSLGIPPYSPVKTLAPPSWSLHHTCWNLFEILRSPEDFSSPGWTSSCSLSLSSQAHAGSYKHIAGPLLNSLLLTDVLLYWEAQNWM